MIQKLTKLPLSVFSLYVAFWKPEILLGSAGRSMPSLYHLYLDGGEPSTSWQDSNAVLPVVTVGSTLHWGTDGGTGKKIKR